MSGDVEVKNAYHGKPWPSKAWPEERLLALQEMWRQGLSAGECSRRLGVTRNAVIGMVHRKGPEMFDRRGGQIKRECNVRKRPAKSPVIKRAQRKAAIVSLAPVDKETVAVVFSTPEPLATPWPVPVVPLDGISFMELRETTCKFPLPGELRPPYRYCGKPSEGPWCPEHKKICYQPYGR